MNTSSSAKVLVDNCIDGLSQTMQGAAKEEEIQWGDSKQRVRIGGYQRKPPLRPEHKWKQRQIECLPTIARLARDGRLSLYIYNEIRFEGWLRPGSAIRSVIGNLFAGVQFIDVEAPIERSRFFQMELGQYLQRQEVVEFCKWLQLPRIEALADKPAIQSRLPESEIYNLRQVKRFRELCRGLSEGQYPDAFHLWTGEANKLDYFLTTDRKFIRAMTETKKIVLPCRPISPEALLAELGVTERDPLPFKLGQFYTVGGKPD
jgi:hypothetical protein